MLAGDPARIAARCLAFWPDAQAAQVVLTMARAVAALSGDPSRLAVRYASIGAKRVVVLQRQGRAA